jgi:5'-deoxynucleotidase YfbR-like HD superfamily hydrolase
MIDQPFSPAWRDMAHVPRWVILRRTRQQFLAEHSYFVTIYANHVARLIKWEGDFYELMSYALVHDLNETITGDIPGPIKRVAFDKALAENAMEEVMLEKFGADVVADIMFVSEDVKAIVSVADSIEEICFLMEECLMGNNKWVQPVLEEATDRLAKRWGLLSGDEEVLKEAWDKTVTNIFTHQLSRPVLMKDPT